MPSITITVSTEAHRRLKNLKEGKESFSEVILRELPEKADTFGDLERILDKRVLPEPNPVLWAEIRKSRGRRPRRERK